jgi:hypothetical protein
MFEYGGRNLCWDCAVKARGIEDEPHNEQWRILMKHLLPPK